MKKWIDVSNVSKTFYEKRNWFQTKRTEGGLKNISFTSSVDSLGILGESGSGKTTLVKLISGIYKYDSGLIKLFNNDGVETKKVSLIFQDYMTAINPEFTIKKALSESIDPAIEKKKVIEKMAYMMKKVGLAEIDLNQNVRQLSGGQIQRVCIARSLLSNSDILIFDEAFSSLDLLITDELLDLLFELKKEFGLRYIFVTHDLELATYFCDQIIFLKSGQMVDSLLTKDLMTTSSEYIQSLINAQF